MNYFSLFLLSFILLSCADNENSRSKKSVLSSSAPQKHESGIDTRYNEQELITFLDSIGHLPTQPLADDLAFYADSVFLNQQKMSKIISSRDFAILKQAAHKKVIAVNVARRIFGTNNIDSTCNTASLFLTYPTGLIPVVYFPLDNEEFHEFALCIGDPEHCANASLYFFNGNKVIARHDGAGRYYGLGLKHYKDADGRTTVYYVHEFTEGSGSWWNNYFFYKYAGDTLLPVLNVLENGNEQSWSFRTFWLEATVQKTNPLTFKMVYDVQFPDTTKTDWGPSLIDDSTLVPYRWNEQAKRLEGDFLQSKITGPQVLSYCLGDNDLLFINSYYPTLKASLADTAKRKGTIGYLSQVKAYYENKRVE